MRINDSGYYISDENDAQGDPESDRKLATHTSERKKDSYWHCKVNLQQQLLINLTLLIITTPIYILERHQGCDFWSVYNQNIDDLHDGSHHKYGTQQRAGSLESRSFKKDGQVQ